MFSNVTCDYRFFYSLLMAESLTHSEVRLSLMKHKLPPTLELFYVFGSCMLSSGQFPGV